MPDHHTSIVNGLKSIRLTIDLILHRTHVKIPQAYSDSSRQIRNPAGIAPIAAVTPQRAGRMAGKGIGGGMDRHVTARGV